MPSLTTAEAAALLVERGVMVKGKPPTARTVKVWCAKGVLRATKRGGNRRGFYEIDRADLDAFTPPVQGRPLTRRPPPTADGEGEQG